MKLCNQDMCTGCSACSNVCPKKAITLEYNERGFLYPIIDKTKCINCGACEKLCNKLKEHMAEEKHKNGFYLAYANRLKDESKLMKSQSGGLFTALAETVLAKDGIVYGVGFGENNHVRHLRVTTLEDLDRLKGSKYVQSDINNTFEQVINDLKNNKLVLFSGTPCQVAGIESLLDFKKINKENFYSCDLICHGVPSPMIYEEFLNFIESKNGKKIIKFNFRDKEARGWRRHVESYYFQSEDNEKVVDNLYTDLFYSNLALRKSCESCNYTSKNRPGDLTMADCWGIEKIKPNLWNDNKGISVCLIQTEHGEKLFDMAKDRLDIYGLKLEEYSQNNLEKSTAVPVKKEKFWKDYKKLSFEKMLKKYTIYGGTLFKVKRKILKKINRW